LQAPRGVDVSYNTFRGNQQYFQIWNRPAFEVRGKPALSGDFHHNVLVHTDAKALRVRGGPYSTLGEHHNQYGTDTAEDLAVGDFDGDGRDDLFHTTGTAWFYSSGGKSEWRFLRASPLRVRQLHLGKFDGDNRTDVVFRETFDWKIWSGGVGGGRVLRAESGLWYSHVFAGDFDADGRSDLLVANGGTLLISKGATGDWLSWGSPPAGDLRNGTHQLWVAKVAGGPGDDLVATGDAGWTWSRNGKSSWNALHSALKGKAPRVVIADFDGDGRADVARTNGKAWEVSWGFVWPWTRIADLSATLPYADVTAGVAGDFDGDRRADLVRFEMAPQIVVGTVPGTTTVIWNSADSLVLSSAASGTFMPLGAQTMR
jgi:hypothetical protein